MINVEILEVAGWKPAIEGMRNPMNSWDKSDSHFDGNVIHIGSNDLDLMIRLVKAGPEHRKFMRQIVVWMNITAPLYWWKEFDTYKVGTVANSCSTMHKIADKEFELEDFSCEHLLGQSELRSYTYEAEYLYYSPQTCLNLIIDILNQYRKLYLTTKDKKYWWQMIQLLPSSYNQKRTVMLNYETLYAIYHQRYNHKLDEWIEFCSKIQDLPYFGEIVSKVQEK